jgi:hypothetical protein
MNGRIARSLDVVNCPKKSWSGENVQGVNVQDRGLVPANRDIHNAREYDSLEGAILSNEILPDIDVLLRGTYVKLYRLQANHYE